MNYLRKKLQGIMTCSDFEGYLRTISGAPPLTLPYSLGKDITSLTLTGNAVQNGTPSPDNPVEIYGVGERTINLFDYVSFFDECTPNALNVLLSEVSYTVKPSTAYTLATNIPLSNSYARVFILNSEDRVSTDKHGAWANNRRVITSSEDGMIKIVVRTQTDGGTDEVSEEEFANGTYWVMLVEGSYTNSTMPPYEPYGYKIPVKFTSDSGDTQTINVFTDKPLYAIGDVGDTIELDFDAKTAVRTNRTILSEFDENTAWAYNGSVIGTYSCTFNTSVTPAREASSAVICNRFKKINTTELSSEDKESGVYEGGAINYVINHNLIGVTAGMSTTEAISMWKSWLSGKTIKVLYQLATPTTTDISSLQNWEASAAIPRGTLTVTTETDVQPAYISAEYYSMKKE